MELYSNRMEKVGDGGSCNNVDFVQDYCSVYSNQCKLKTSESALSTKYFEQYGSINNVTR